MSSLTFLPFASFRRHFLLSQIVTTPGARKSPKVSPRTGGQCVKLMIREVRAVMFSMFDISVESMLTSTVRGVRDVKIHVRYRTAIPSTDPQIGR